jgi:protein-tyrosine phosphatase
MGGYQTADKRTVSWRMLYRAGAFDVVAPEDDTALGSLRLRTVIDLRTHGEINTRGRFPVSRFEVDYHHLPIIDRTWDRPELLSSRLEPVDFLVLVYEEMLDDGGDRIASVFSALAGAQFPAVIHCAAGKDRTGVVAALLLKALGVSDADVAADFALTNDAMPHFLEVMRARYPERVERMASMPAGFFTAPAEAMLGLLRRIEERHGSVMRYLASIGVTLAEIDTLQATLLGWE